VVGFCEHSNELRFVAFPVTEYDEVFLGYQPGQMVEVKNQCFRDHVSSSSGY
jgi:hypothetical protein